MKSSPHCTRNNLNSNEVKLTLQNNLNSPETSELNHITLNSSNSNGLKFSNTPEPLIHFKVNTTAQTLKK